MSTPPQKPQVLPIVLVPAVMTLALTLLRLAGELMRWSERLFSREAGGGAALVGIVWLVPLFGIYFALRLVRAGHGPDRRWRPVGFAFAGLGAVLVLSLSWGALGLSPLVQIVALAVSSTIGAAVAYLGWQALGRTLLAYGLAARIPVMAIMLIAIFADWGTHYELGRPDLPPVDPPLLRWVVIGVVPQLGFWVPFTIIFGAICGSVTAAVVSRSQGARGKESIP